MANASSLFLPGSNLTNLLVLSDGHVSGRTFFTQMLPIALAATSITAAGLVLIHRRRLLVHGERVHESAVALHLGLGLWGAMAGAVLIVVLRNAALPVLGIGLVLLLVRALQARMSVRETLSRLGIPVLVSLFGLSVALGTLARASAFPADLVHSAGAPVTAVVAALASVLVNNLPAAVLLSSGSHLHTSALLLGLNVGTQSRCDGLAGGPALVAGRARRRGQALRARLLTPGSSACSAGAARALLLGGS